MDGAYICEYFQIFTFSPAGIMPLKGVPFTFI